ncbi:MAG: TIGR04282 family arsenosugar biosynthesis glycosyltransferase [Bacteroidota bacterium]
MSTGLIIFVKNPELGKVKTRLAQTVGDEQALFIYKQLLEITSTVAKNSLIPSLIFFSENIPKDLGNWKHEQFSYHVQTKGSLGEKMADAFHQAFKKFDRVLIIGSDCPYITADLLKEASNHLDQNDVVIGPAEDGGYYLIGMNKMYIHLFKDIPWSSASVFEETKSKVIQSNLRLKTLKTLSDIDYEEDWKVYLGFRH